VEFNVARLPAPDVLLEYVRCRLAMFGGAAADDNWPYLCMLTKGVSEQFINMTMYAAAATHPVNDYAISRAFGLRATAYAKLRREALEVVAANLTKMHKAEAESRVARLTRDTTSDGFVYFVQATSRVGPIKIGKAEEPLSRLAELQQGSPIELCILATTAGGLKLERALHARFAEFRIHGEWFQPAPVLLDYIAEAHPWKGPA
jgi:hypothetical protein